MLLYALLHLTGYDLPLERAQAVPPVGQPHARAPGAATSRRASRRPPARSARASATRVGLAIAEAHLAARFNRPGHDGRRPLHLRPRQRRRPDGGRRLRGLLAGRPPRARQAHRPLRRQPRLARRHDVALPSPRTSARASRPTAGTSSTSPTATTSAPSTRRSTAPARVDDAAVAHRRAHAHRLRRAAQAGHLRGPRLAARSGRGAGRQGEPRLAAPSRRS